MNIITKHKILFTIILITILLICGCGIYVSDYYHASEESITVFSDKNSTYIESEVLSNNSIIYIPENPKAGLIFYQGGKVEYTAYKPLMTELASKGIMCVLVEMPFNLAVLDIDAADGIREEYPEIEDWYIGGHSLGGSMASLYLEENYDVYKGLILLGSYSTTDLREYDLDVLSIYGSEDNVLNKEKYHENIVNLPSDFVEIVIDGGCHAYFGMYGKQEGDGEPSISNEQQIYITANEISKFIK